MGNDSERYGKDSPGDYRVRLLPPAAYLPTAKGLLGNFVTRRRVFPFYASFKLTCRCHFGCPFCNVKKDRTDDLSTEDIKKVLDNLSRSSVLMTSFEGGEPLLREDIGELIDYAARCKFYLLFTTSHRKLLEHPLERYARNIDFLHVSIDEGHGNLDLFDLLDRLVNLPTQVSVQTVVTRDTIGALEDKVRRCCRVGANIVIIPATHMDNAENHFPDIEVLEKKMLHLRRKYPDTIHTPQGYFSAYVRRKCSSASIIIAPDGRLYYPCHILGSKGPDLRSTELNTWLRSAQARQLRGHMANCTRNCGWYQYYSIDSYTSISSVWEALRPMVVQGKRRG
ncbi:MAG: radical SAM protein [Chitinivibrionales bacterium]|nr:radical SAM protein [Chitinivibrionales bacterium]